MADKEFIDVDNTDMVEEVHDRIDALIEVLEKKGIMTKEEFDAKFADFVKRKYDE